MCVRPTQTRTSCLLAPQAAALQALLRQRAVELEAQHAAAAQLEGSLHAAATEADAAQQEAAALRLSLRLTTAEHEEVQAELQVGMHGHEAVLEGPKCLGSAAAAAVRYGCRPLTCMVHYRLAELLTRHPPRLPQRAHGELEQLQGEHSVLIGRMRCIEGSEQACRWALHAARDEPAGMPALVSSAQQLCSA